MFCRRRLTAFLAVLVTTALLASPVAAATDPAAGPDVGGTEAHDPGPDGSPAAEAAAEQALATVQEALTPDGDDWAGDAPERRDLTLALRDLRLGLRHLDHEDRALARELLARPTERHDEFAYTRPARARNTCGVSPVPGADICVYWESGGSVHSPDEADGDYDGVPDYVEAARDELQLVWDRIVTQGGYRAPLADGRGYDDRLDVYLADIGGDGLYGYCAAEKLVKGLSASGYCVLDNDYTPSQFPSMTPLDNLRVTGAHEFFHTVQFAYDSAEDPWLMEGTAAWVEDEIYDDLNDNRQFIRGGPMTHPRVPLDAPGHGSSDFYHPWTWWRHLGELEPEDGGSGLPLIIRHIWEGVDATNRAADHDSMQATVAAVRATGRSFTRVVAKYGEAKRHPGDVFEEGGAWPTVPLQGSWQVAGGRRTSWKTATLSHLSSQSFSFVPGRRTDEATWRLRIRVDSPRRNLGSHVQVSALHTDGRRVIRRVALNPRGNGRIITHFSSAQIRRVELTVTNAGHRYDCWRGTYLSCRGRPLDDGRHTRFRGIVFQE